MVNDTGILVVRQARGNVIRVAPQCVVMDLGTQPIMIDKRLAQELRLTANNLAPCPFVIVTSIGHVEQATGYTREPLLLTFRVKPGDPSTPPLLRCAVANATNYVILVGQQEFYPSVLVWTIGLRKLGSDMVGRLETAVRILFMCHSW